MPRWSGEEASQRVEGEGAARRRQVHVREGGADTEGSSCEALGLVRAGIGDKVEGFLFSFFFNRLMCAAVPRSLHRRVFDFYFDIRREISTASLSPSFSCV